MLTEKQSEVLNAITDYIESHGYMPSIRELCEKVGLSSTSTIHGYLVRLEKKGFIKREVTMPRAMNVLKMQPPKPIAIADMKPFTFGSFIRQKRTERGIHLKEISGMLNLAESMLGSIERDVINSFPLDKLELLARLLELSEEDKSMMFDLAGKGNSIVSPDLTEYIMERDYVRTALRLARDSELGEEAWSRLIENIKGEKEKSS